MNVLEKIINRFVRQRLRAVSTFRGSLSKATAWTARPQIHILYANYNPGVIRTLRQFMVSSTTAIVLTMSNCRHNSKSFTHWVLLIIPELKLVSWPSGLDSCLTALTSRVQILAGACWWDSEKVETAVNVRLHQIAYVIIMINRLNIHWSTWLLISIAC